MSISGSETNFNVDDIIEFVPESPKSIANVVSLYQCNKCYFMNASYDVIERHYQIHENEEVVLLCSICYGQYPSLEVMRNHMIKDHKLKPISSKKDESEKLLNKRGSSEKKPIAEMEEVPTKDDCVLPLVPFKDFRILIKRLFVHKCPMAGCKFKFETIEKLEMHIKCHKSSKLSEMRDFKCMECGLENQGWRNCSTHLWKTHKVEVDLLSCPLCLYKAMACVQIWHHMKIHKRWKSKVLKSIKSKITETPKEPVQPKNKYYTEKTCEICDRKFVNGKTLSKHVKSVHNKIKPFICNVCGRKCARKSTLTIHMRQHTGETPLACKKCPFKARDPSVLKKHEKRHDKTKPHKCVSCDYSSVQTSNLKKHIKLNHPEEFKKISCELCNFISINVDRLAAHKKDHQKGLIVNCEDSSDLFKNPRNYNNTSDKRLSNMEISSDCFLPAESTDSIVHDPALDTGGVTIPAHSEDTQFATYLNS